MSEPAPEAVFYHLAPQPLEKVLPVLLEKTLERGWRAVVKVGNEERLAALDLALWTYADDSFLPHGTVKSGFEADQPVFLTTGDDIPNGARVRFVVDGAAQRDFASVIRTIFVFDGHDLDAIARARDDWIAAKAAGCPVTYWQQDPSGRWTKKG